MRLDTPRIPPLTQAEWTGEQRTALEPYTRNGPPLNIFATLAHNPDAFKAFLAWGGYVLRRSDLSPRQRELLILRIGHLCDSKYEWTQHSRLAKQAGMTDEEIERIRIGRHAPAWTDQERVLLRAADDLHKDHFVSDDTWVAMRSFLNDRQCMDVVFIVGHYTQVCMILNSFGIQVEGGQS
jgi:4-carboxymuconolactone decarboxylase